MRGGYNRPARPEEELEAEAARRRLRQLQALVAAGAAEGGTRSAVDGQERPSSLLPASAAPAAARLPQPASSQPNLPFSSTTAVHPAAAASLPSASLTMAQQQHPFGFGFPSHPGPLSRFTEAQAPHDMASFLQERRLALERTQLTVQVQAQAQARARLQDILGREAETRERLMLLRQQRQQQQVDNLLLAGGRPGQRTSAEANALSAAAAAAAAAGSGPLMPPSPTHTPAYGFLPGSLRGGGINTPWNLSNALPVASLDEALAGKILRLESGRAADLALQAHDRTPFSTGPFATRRPTQNDSKEGKRDDDDAYNAFLQEQKMQHPDQFETSGPGQFETSGDEESDTMNDDAYFRAHPRPSRLEDKSADVKRPREPFPLKLYRILYEAEKNGQSDIISFLPHGRAFTVHKSKEFIRDIMPKYFAAGRMNTFLKQLNLYFFVRITDGKDKGAYRHPKFARGKRHLCKKIKRKRTTNLPSKEEMAATAACVASAAPGVDGSDESSASSRGSPIDMTKLHHGETKDESISVLEKEGKLKTPSSPSSE